MKKSNRNKAIIEILDAVVWLALNYISIVLISVGVNFLINVYDGHFTISITITDYSLITYSILFNIFTYALGLFDSTSDEDFSSELKRFAEKIVTHYANEPMEELKGRLQKLMTQELTKPKIKAIRETNNKRIKTRTLVMRIRKAALVFTALFGISCVMIYAVLMAKGEDKIADLTASRMYIIIITVLLILGLIIAAIVYIFWNHLSDHTSKKK